jgi:hypothetical protein
MVCTVTVLCCLLTNCSEWIDACEAEDLLQQQEQD